MKTLAAITLLLVVVSPAFAQYYFNEYDIERWNEDYSYLRYPGSHTDFFDPIKYVPLNSSGDTYLSFGGQARYRYDYFNNTEFGAGPQDENGFHLFRFLAHVDAHFGRNVRVFLQFNSGLVFDRVGGPRPGDADDFDVQQGFADVNFPFSDTNNLMVRFGRQELIYGAQRLISPNDWGNVRRSFEGLRMSLTMPNNTLDAFLVRPVIVEKGHFNSSDDHTAFAGIYNVTAFPDLLPHASPKLDAYLLLLDRGLPGEVYNVCSGEGRSIGQLLQQLQELAGTRAEIRVDPDRLRSTEIPWLVGNPGKLEKLGWRRRRSLRDALSQVLEERQA